MFFIFIIHNNLGFFHTVPYQCPTSSRSNKMDSGTFHCSLFYLVAMWRSGRFPFPKWAASFLKQKEMQRSIWMPYCMFVFYQSRQDTLSLWWLRNAFTNSEKSTVTINLSPRECKRWSHSNLTATAVLSPITSHWQPRQRFPTSAWVLCSHSTDSLPYYYTKT